MQPSGNRSRGTTGGVRSKNPLPLGWAPAWAESSPGISLYIMQTGELKLKELLVQPFCVQFMFWSIKSTPPLLWFVALPNAVLWSIMFPEPSTPTSIPLNPFASTVFWRATLFLALKNRRPSEEFPVKLLWMKLLWLPPFTEMPLLKLAAATLSLNTLSVEAVAAMVGSFVQSLAQMSIPSRFAAATTLCTHERWTLSNSIPAIPPITVPRPSISILKTLVPPPSTEIMLAARAAPCMVWPRSSSLTSLTVMEIPMAGHVKSFARKYRPAWSMVLQAMIAVAL